MSQFRPSHFNFVFPVREGELLYNTYSGAAILLAGSDVADLAATLVDSRQHVDLECLPESVFSDLLDGGFLAPLQADEVKGIRDRYWTARRKTPMVLTITTTMDCNLGCYYCYEERSTAKLESGDVPTLVEFARARLRTNSRSRLHVSWYGGEPLLNATFMETASLALQEMCMRENVEYVASIISNGTRWPVNVGEFVALHQLKQTQISFDGMQRHHDKRRRYRSKAVAKSVSSFEVICSLVDKLVHHTNVDIRFNLDSTNKGDLIPFFEFAGKRGWLSAPFPATIQIARVSAYTDHAKFIRKVEISDREFDELRAGVRSLFGTVAKVQESEIPSGFPSPKTSVCAALAFDSAVIGADKQTYRCGLQVSERHRATGALQGSSFKGIPISTGPTHSHQYRDAEWWATFDPTTLPTCKLCSFLPICWAGCPKKFLDDDQHAILEQGSYWRRNLPRLVANGLGYQLREDTQVSEAHQFRERPGLNQ